MSSCVVVDANRLFSALIAGSHRVRQLLTAPPGVQFVAPKYVFVELFKHKERIVKASSLDEAELLGLLHSLLERVHFFDQDAIRIGCWAEAWRLCRDVDEKDVAYVALTLELDGRLWTGDRELENGLRRKGFDRFFSGPAARNF